MAVVLLDKLTKEHMCTLQLTMTKTMFLHDSCFRPNCPMTLTMKMISTQTTPIDTRFP